jgi:hypothetical protein
MSTKGDDITISLDRGEAIHAAERLLSSGDQREAQVAEVLLRAARPGPDRVDIDDRYDSRTDQIRYRGFATRQPNGLYRVLAEVGGALCIVEVTMHFDPPPADAPRVAIGEDAPSEGPR